MTVRVRHWFAATAPCRANVPWTAYCTYKCTPCTSSQSVVAKHSWISVTIRGPPTTLHSAQYPHSSRRSSLLALASRHMLPPRDAKRDCREWAAGGRCRSVGGTSVDDTRRLARVTNAHKSCHTRLGSKRHPAATFYMNPTKRDAALRVLFCVRH